MKNIPKTKLKKIISTTLSFFVIIIMGFSLYNNQSLFENLSRLNPLYFVVISLLQPIKIGISALINKLIIDSINKKIPFWDAFMLQYVNKLLNKFIAESGAVYRGVYLRTQFSFPLSKYLSSIGGSYIVGVTTNAVIGIILTIIIYFQQRVYNLVIILIFILLFCGSILLLFIEPKLNPSNWFYVRINRVIEGWIEIKKDPKLIFYIFILNILGSIVSSFSIFLIYRGLDMKIYLLNSFYYNSISTLATIINLTPGGLGINEAALMFSSDVIGLPSDIIFLGAILFRAVSLITSLIAGSISYLILNYKNTNNKKRS